MMSSVAAPVHATESREIGALYEWPTIQEERQTTLRRALRHEYWCKIPFMNHERQHIEQCTKEFSEDAQPPSSQMVRDLREVPLSLED